MSTSLMLGFDGAKCCGIKTIRNFWGEPDTIIPALKKTPSSKDKDVWGECVTSKTRFFTDSAPAESNIDRSDRYIEYVCEHRPDQIISIALAEIPDCEERDKHRCQSTWFPIVEERGFKRVTSALNSNSGNIVHVYHLVIKDGKVQRD